MRLSQKGYVEILVERFNCSARILPILFKKGKNLIVCNAQRMMLNEKEMETIF